MGVGRGAPPVLFLLLQAWDRAAWFSGVWLRAEDPELALLGQTEKPGELSWTKYVTVSPSCLENVQGDVSSMKGVGWIQVWNLRFTGGARRVFVRGYRDPRDCESTQSRDLPPKIDALFAVLWRREGKLLSLEFSHPPIVIFL